MKHSHLFSVLNSVYQTNGQIYISCFGQIKRHADEDTESVVYAAEHPSYHAFKTAVFEAQSNVLGFDPTVFFTADYADYHFCVNMQDVINELEISYLDIADLFTDEIIPYIIRGEEKYPNMWMTQDGYEAVCAYVSSNVPTGIGRIGVVQEETLDIDAPMIELALMESLIDGALARGDKEEFMRLTNLLYATK